jgi:hypothetical protein
MQEEATEEFYREVACPVCAFVYSLWCVEKGPEDVDNELSLPRQYLLEKAEVRKAAFSFKAIFYGSTLFYYYSTLKVETEL